MFNSILKAGWLTDFTTWLLGALKALWDAFAEFMGDLFLVWLKHTLDMVVMVFSMLPEPTFLNGASLQSLFGSAGATIGWWITVLQIDKCMAVIASACVFYIIRRILTVGIW
ncbi:phage coat protein [Xanthomonas sp. CFBP 7912]|uniref:phage coat protein n=1 Tax=Xanthomonas sp. CFBP 7912 TaxID=1891621 RepID=UPI000CEDEFA5|nr:phage coat protein [Xanthomonas sp. CFBP 7912]PPU32374.1 phage coat protein [Xanthomonas sp. CFBP 7912]